MKRIYLDHNATTPIHPDVLTAMMPYFTDFYGNPSSIHSSGRRAKEGIDTARRQIASLINAHFNEIIFTSGGSESNNIALHSVLSASHSINEKPVHFITSSVEHSSVYNTAISWQKRGVNLSLIHPTKNGQFDIDNTISQMNENTKLISIMLANNETGHIFNLKPIIEKAHSLGILVHCDAVQALGKIPINVKELDVDFLSMSAHKLNGAKGIGALYIKKGTPINPLIKGGSQEFDWRAGTQNVPLIVGFGKACQIASSDVVQQLKNKQREQRNTFFQLLEEKIPKLHLNTPIADSESLPNTLNVSFLGVDAHSLLVHLDRKGIDISVGSACNAGTIYPSRTLLNFGFPMNVVTSAIRFSLGHDTTDSELEEVSQITQFAVEKLRH